MSLLLVFVMAISMIPTGIFTMTASAADDADWIVLGDSSNYVDYYWFHRLVDELRSDGTSYIRINEDIEVEGEYFGEIDEIQILNNKTLDLNGHKIIFKCIYDIGTIDPMLFDVREGTIFTLDDSEGSGGEIRYEYALNADNANLKQNSFIVHDGGSMIVNGGKITGGISKKLHVDDAVNDDGSEYYSGKIFFQSLANGITIKDGGTLTVNGGEITGRGNGCAVIKADAGSNVLINDGHFVAKGRSNVISAAEGSNVLVRGGHFELSSYFNCTGIDSKHFSTNNYLGGLGFGDSNELIDVSSSLVEISKHSSESMNDESIYIYSVEPQGGKLTIDSVLDENGAIWMKGTEGIITASYVPYYSEGVSVYLDNDYCDDTYHQTLLTWTLRKGKDSVVSTFDCFAPEGTYSIDLNKDAFLYSNGTPVMFTSGETYYVDITVTETWNNSNKYVMSSEDSVVFDVYDTDTYPLTTTYQQTSMPGIGNYMGKTLEHVNAEFIFGPSQETIDSLNGNSLITSWDYWTKGIYSYSDDGTTLQTEIDYADCEYGGTYAPQKSGVQSLITFFRLTDENGSYIRAIYDDIFVMPPVKASTDGGSTFTVLEGDRVDPVDETGVVLSANIEDLLKDDIGTILNDPKYDVPLTLARLSWVMYNKDTGEWEKVNSTDGLYSIDPDTREITIYRAGLYRACFYYNGHLFYSPRAIQVGGIDFDTNQQCWTKSYMVMKDFGDGQRITILTNSRSAKWSDDLSYILTLKGNPTGSNKIIKASNFVNGTGFFNMDDIFKAGTTADEIVPGTYAFEVSVKDNTYGNRCYAPSYLFVIYQKRSTDFDVFCEGKNLTKQTTYGKYTLPGGTDTCHLTSGPYPLDSTYPDRKYSYSSMKTDVATVDENGVITAHHPGTARIRVISSNDDTVKMIDVTVQIGRASCRERV